MNVPHFKLHLLDMHAYIDFYITPCMVIMFT